MSFNKARGSPERKLAIPKTLGLKHIDGTVLHLCRPHRYSEHFLSWWCHTSRHHIYPEGKKDWPLFWLSTACHSQGLAECRSGQCFPSTFQCDGDEDCRDGTDEENCSQSKCVSPTPCVPSCRLPAEPSKALAVTSCSHGVPPYILPDCLVQRSSQRWPTQKGFLVVNRMLEHHTRTVIPQGRRWRLNTYPEWEIWFMVMGKVNTMIKEKLSTQYSIKLD